MSRPALSVQNLQTHFFTPGGVVKAVDGVTFDVAGGEILGLVGESGSGKSITGFSILGLVDAPGRVVGGNIIFDGKDLATLSANELRHLRGKNIAMIFQDPLMTLNPVLTIGTQMIEAIRAHAPMSHEFARRRAAEALGLVGMASPEERLKSYPHQFSGGMRQRVAIAIALLHKPQLIIADEPTTALDVTIQAQILAQMQKLCRDFGLALVWISHDLGVVAGLADRVAVMYAGRIVEIGPVDDLLDRPAHPYTIGLLHSVPGAAPHGEKLYSIPGQAPSPLERAPGCPFAPRCTFATEICATDPPLETHGARQWACHHPQIGVLA